MKGRKQDKSFKLDIPFDDALRRFVRTSPAELAESIEAEKKSREAAEKVRRESEKTDPIRPS